MDVTQASTFLVSSILFGLGAVVICAVLILLNNLFAKYWKPIKWININHVDPVFFPTKVDPTETAVTTTTTVGNI